MRIIINLLALLISQTIFAQSEIYLTTGDTETNLQDAINDNSVGTIHIRTDIQVNSDIIIPSNKVITFSAMSELIINSSGNITFQNAYIDAGKYQVIKGNNFSGKLTNDIVYPEWFGAKVDDGIDDSFAIQKAIDLTNRNIYSTQGEYILKQPIDVTCNLDLNKAIFKFVLDGRKECLRMKTNSSVKNGTIINEGTNPQGAGQFQCPVVIGDYGSGASYNSIVMENLTIETNRPNGNGILVTGASNQIKIKNINFPDSKNLARAILIHWGGANSVTSDTPRTYHPFNIIIDNIKVGKMTFSIDDPYYHQTDSSLDKPKDTGVIFISGAYDVKVTNVYAEESYWSFSLANLFVGDHGIDFIEDEAIKRLVGKGIILENFSSKKSHFGAVKVDYKQSKPLNGTPIFYGPSLKSLKAVASDDNSHTGIVVSNVDNVRVINCNMIGFTYGLGTGEKVSQLTIDGGEYAYNKRDGIKIGNGNFPPVSTVIKNVRIFNNGKNQSTDDAGIRVQNGIATKIINNVIGADDETQIWGVRIDKGSLNIIEGNYVENTFHSAFSIGSYDSYDVVYRFKGNSASNNVGVFYSGASPMIIDTKMIENTNLLIRECIGRGIPTTGHWNKGDRIYNNFVSYLYSNGWVCVQSGEGAKAQWKPFSLID